MNRGKSNLTEIVIEAKQNFPCTAALFLDEWTTEELGRLSVIADTQNMEVCLKPHNGIVFIGIRPKTNKGEFSI